MFQGGVFFFTFNILLIFIKKQQLDLSRGSQLVSTCPGYSQKAEHKYPELEPYCVVWAISKQT